jgi:hypothetical protein
MLVRQYYMCCMTWGGIIHCASSPSFRIEKRLARRVESFGDVDDVGWLRQPEPGGTTGECSE